MPNTKKVNQEERKQQLSEKEELEQMLLNSSETLEHLTEEAKKLSPKHKPLVFDYQELKQLSLDESTDIVGSNAMFYLNDEIIDTEDYVQQKMRADVVTMSDLLRQAKIAEYAIIKMIEQIEEGDVHPRRFEVLSGFQRSKLELTKAIANYIVVMENNYKAIKEDWRTKQNENTLNVDGEDVSAVDGNGDMTTRGTRSLMQTIRTELDRKQFEENKEKMAEAEENRLKPAKDKNNDE